MSSSLGYTFRAQQICGCDHEPRRAEAALHRACRNESLLHLVQPAVIGQPLHRDDLVPLRLRGQHEARADELAVQQHGARAALPLLARVLRSREAELLAERKEQAFALPDVGLMRFAVDAQLDLHTRHRSSARF